MGMNVQTRGGTGYGGRRTFRPMSEINVTPFIDVMLVLLIVFMVTAPLLTAGVQVDLPKSEAGSVNDKDEKPLEVTVSKSGVISIGETKVSKEELIVKLSAITGDDVERRVFIRADQGLSYGVVMEIIGSINKAGYRKVALISEPSSVGRR
ncbi:MAG: protein TolR [Alphaproteobacteria bacterium]|jgi:biopolymer transport protein TolR|nr:protein TolR [Alphaproteobacteria bacterium]MBP9867329.1 protein TolR [Alphaproteobacteria bacterium]